LEVTRVCTNRELPAALTKDACSMLYGAAARKARQQQFERVLTYTRLSEPGTSLRAAGFKPVAISRGGTWNRSHRPRAAVADTGPKVRWERHFPENAGLQAARDPCHSQLSLFDPRARRS
jgi:hypothetical protein